MNPNLLAKFCYNLIHTLRLHRGAEDELKTWENAPEATKARYVAGVAFVIENGAANLKAIHDNWLKLTEGVEGKTREEFDSLDIYEQMERHAFAGAISELLTMEPELVKTVTIPVPVKVPAQGQQAAPIVKRIPIAYIGNRPFVKDRIYGTGLVWENGQTLLVSEALAHRFLKHPDVWALGKEEVAQEKEPEKTKVREETKNDDNEAANALQEAVDQVGRIETKEGLLQFAAQHFPTQKFHPNIGVPLLRERITTLLNQFGANK